jgi:hypothetical protein
MAKRKYLTFLFYPSVTQKIHSEYFLLLTTIGFFGATKVSLILSDAVWIRQRPLEKFRALDADAVHSWSSKHIRLNTLNLHKEMHALVLEPRRDCLKFELVSIEILRWLK